MTVEQELVESTAEEPVFIYQSRRKQLARALGSLVFVVLSAWLWVADLSYPRIIVDLIAVVGILFFGFAFLWLLYKLSQNEPIIEINSEGLLDNSSALSAGMIRWEEIETVDKTSLFGETTLSITPTDVDAYLARQNSVRRTLISINRRLVGAPINISQSNLPISIDELLTDIRQYRGQQ